jgi:hypothetical protein
MPCGPRVQAPLFFVGKIFLLAGNLYRESRELCIARPVKSLRLCKKKIYNRMVSGLHSESVVLKIEQALVGHAARHGLLLPSRCQGRTLVLALVFHRGRLESMLGRCGKVFRVARAESL